MAKKKTNISFSELNELMNQQFQSNPNNLGGLEYFRKVTQVEKTPQSQRTDFQKALLEDFENERKLKEFERAVKKDNEVRDAFEKRKALLAAEDKASNWFGDIGNFFNRFADGLSQGELDRYIKTDNGLVLRRKNSHTGLGGVDTRTGTYDSSKWEEVDPEIYLAEQIKVGERRAASGVYDAGFKVSSALEGIAKMAFYDLGSGIMRTIGTIGEGELGEAQRALMKNSFDKFLKNAEIGYYELGNKWFDGDDKDSERNWFEKLMFGKGEKERLKELIAKQDELTVEEQNLKIKLKEAFDEKAKKGNSEKEKSYLQEWFDLPDYNEFVEDLFADSDNYYEQQTELRQNTSKIAASLENRQISEFLNEDDATPLDTKLIPLAQTREQIPFEIMPEGKESLWDAKRLILNSDGTPMVDATGAPVYKDKYGLADKLSKGNYWDMFSDKYGSEQMIDAGVSATGFLIGGGLIGKGVGAAAKGLTGATKLITSNTRFMDGLSKAFKTPNLAPIANKVGDKILLNAQTLANAYLMTNTESQMIGQQTYEKVYEDYINEKAQINVKEIENELAQRGYSDQELQLRTDLEVRKRRSEFEEENPDIIADAIGVASAAKELTTSINNMNTLMNLNYGAFFAHTKSFSTALKTNPFSKKNLAKGGLVALREAGQEYIEEGIMNNYSQMAGELLAKGKVMSLNDYIENNLADKESVTSGVIGAFMGMGMANVTSGIQSRKDYAAYKKQQKEIENIKKISDYSKEDLRRFLNETIDGGELTLNILDINRLLSEGNVEEAKLRADTMLLNKSIRAALNGTSGVLTDTLTDLMNQEDMSQEDKANLQTAIELNNLIASTNDAHIHSVARNKIMENRGLKYLLTRERDNAINHVSPTLDKQHAEEIERIARQTLNSQNPTAYQLDNYSELLDQIKNVTTLPSDNVIEKSYQSNKKFINDLQKSIDALEDGYRNLTSDKYQEDYLNTVNEIRRDNIVKNVTPENAEEKKEELQKEGILTKEVEKEIEKKVNEKKAQENVGIDTTQEVAQPAPKLKEGSEQPTKAQEDLLDKILSGGESLGGVEKEWMSPRARNENKPEQSDAVKNWASELRSELGREPQFKDFVEKVIKTKSYAYADSVFLGLRDMLGANGIDVSDAQNVYNNTFSAMNTVMDLVENLLQPTTETEVISANKSVQQNVIDTTSRKFGIISEQEAQYQDNDDSEDRRTANPLPKAAFNRLDSKRIDDVTWAVMSRGLTTDSIIDNDYILDAEYMKEGKQLTAHVMDIDEIPMTEYGADGKFSSTTWGEVKKKLKPGSPEYMAKVPIIVRDGEIPLFMIHEVSWYNTRNISDRFGEVVQEDIIDRGRKNLQRVRENIISGNNTLQIIENNFGAVDNLQQHVDSTPVSIQEAAGNSSTLAVLKIDGKTKSLFTKKTSKFGGIVKGLDAVDASGNSVFKDGEVVDIRWAYNNSEGKPVYMVFKTMNNSPIAPEGNLKQNLPENVVNNNLYATLANVVLSNKDNADLRQAIEDTYGISLDKAEKIKSQLKSDTGIDIVTHLADYMSLYVQMGTDGRTLQELATNQQARTGLTYFSTKYLNREGEVKSTPNRVQVMHKTDNTYGGQIEIGGKLTQGRTVQQTMNALDILFNPSSGIFTKTQLNTNISYLGKNDIILRDIDNSGNFIADSQKDYTTFLKNNLRTNILSHEITTVNGSNKWVLDVQPMIYYDLATEAVDINDLPQEVKAEVVKEQLEETAKEVLGDVATQEVTTSVEQQKADIERKKQGKDNKIENITYENGIFGGSFLDNYEFIAEGSESRVYRSKDGTHVIKISEPYNSKDESLFNSRITNTLLREIIGNSGLEVIGYYEHNGVKNPIYKQNFIDGKTLSEKEVVEYLKTIEGVIEIDGKFYYKYDNKLYAISDFSDNVIQDKNGNIVPIDLDVYEVTDSEINAKYDAELNSTEQQSQPNLTFEEATQGEIDLQDFKDENSFYRIIVGDAAFNDILESGLVRTNAQSKKKESILDKLKNRPTSFPSFSKGSPSIEYAEANPNHYIIVTQDSSIKPSTSGRHGKGTTMFPTDENGNHLRSLDASKVKVYKHIGNNKYILAYENGQNLNTQEIQETVSFEEAIQELSVEQQQELEEFLRRIDEQNGENFNSRWSVSEEQSTQLDNLSSNNISGLTTEQNKKLVSSLKNAVIGSIDFRNHVTIGAIKEALLNSIETHIEPKLDNKKAILNALSKVPNMGDKIASLQEEINALESIVNEQEKLISTTRDNLGSLTKEFNRIFNVNFEEEIAEDSEENIGDEAYSKSFLEKEIKLSYSMGLRLSLFGIPIQNSTGQSRTNFTGLADYHTADDVDLLLKDITSTIPSNWDMLIERLKDRYHFRQEKIYKQLEDKLNNLPQHLKNELLYKMISKKLDIYKVMNSLEVTFVGGEPVVSAYNIRVYDENSTKEDLRLKNTIINSFETSDFAMYDDRKDIILNTEYANTIQKALSKYVAENAKEVKVDAFKVKEIFNKVGLEAISLEAIEEYLKKGENPFQKKRGILWFINEKLKKLNAETATGKKVYLTEKKNNLFSDSRGSLNKLVSYEILVNGGSVARSIRINDKIMQGIIANTSLYDIVADIKNLDNSELFKAFINNPLTRNNTILELLQNDEKFREAFSVGFSSPDAYKIHGKNNYGNTDFDKIAKQDNLITVLGLYTNTFGNLELSDSKFKKGLEFRTGQMPVLTLADKGRMAYLTTALLELKGDNIIFDEQGNARFSEEVNNHLAQQIFESELDRIIDSYENPNNVLNYSQASKIFLALPLLNALEYKGQNIHTYLLQPAVREKIKTDVTIREELNKEASKLITDYLNAKLNEKISFGGTQGQLVEYGIYSNEVEEDSTISIHNMDTEYVKGKPGKTDLDKLRYTIAEFEMNTLLNFNNIHSLFLGDMAFYSKDKTIDRLVGKEIDPTKISRPEVYSEIAKEIGTIVHKRAASLIAPGFKLANSENPNYDSQNFMHIAINDVEGMSDILKNLIEQQYGKLSPEANEVFNEIITINKSLEVETDAIEIKRLKDRKDSLIKNNLADVQDYFNITGTDAQEYTTWKAHIDMMFRQGTLTTEEKNLLTQAYEKLNRGEEVNKEELELIMQPVKPVYTGLVPYENVIRPVYIKASSFPLLPQLTKNLDIDNVRKKLETLESENNMVVRMSYQTANKIGSLKTSLTMDDLYNSDLKDIRTKLDSATSILPFSNFKIQQETPSKEDKAYKKGKDSYITMGSQFFKIILGNGINKMKENVFPNLFSPEILKMAGVKDKKGNLNGEDLDKIYFSTYNEYSKLLKENLYSEVGIDINTSFHNLPVSVQNNIIENLNKVMRREIIERGQPDYLEDVIKLIEEEGNLLQTTMPIIFDANRYKFEALLQAIVANRLITHKLPGNAHISASSEGFRKTLTLEDVSSSIRDGIIWTGPRETRKDLQATINEDGEIIASEVIIKSHWKVRDEEGNFKYVDLSSDEYSENIIEDGKVVGRQLLVDKIDPQILENFSFRIPTSSHQSGVILKVVGFLPAASGDLLLVPKEHTTQLGEDYDIDKRYVYKSNYYVDSATGNIKKLEYTDIKEQLDALESMFSQGDITFDKLTTAVTGTALEEIFFEELEELRDKGLRLEGVDSINKIGKRTLNEFKIKMLENTLIDIYKSVYKSPSAEVQRKIFKPLVTDVAGTTADLMEEYTSTDVDNTYFSTLSDSYQRDLLKNGADGKGGIGVHSNAVTMEAQLQRLEEENKLRILVGYDNKTNAPIWFKEDIGGLVSEGYLGKDIKTLDGDRDVSDQHGENQNVSTDNINKGIMGKRNENSYTMSIYSFMAHMGWDKTKDIVDTGILGKDGKIINTKLHLPSLFMKQPVLVEYVKLREKYDSLTSEFVDNVDNIIYDELALKFGFNDYQDKTKPITNRMDVQAYNTASRSMTGQVLWNNQKRKNADPEIQQAVLQKFLRFQQRAKELSEIQQLINLSTSKLGISYFEVIQKINVLNTLPHNDFKNATKLIGEHYSNIETKENYQDLLEEEELKHYDLITQSELTEAEDLELQKLEASIEAIRRKVNDPTIKSKKQLQEEGYTLVGRYYWKPTTIEGVQLVNSLKAAEDVMPINFPYNNTYVQSLISGIFNNKKNADVNKKSTANLKWKYEIMSALNDFIASDVGLFDGDINQERKRLFFTTSAHKSLASIIKDLKMSKNPIMDNSLLKDLEYKIGLPGDPSTIVHLTDYNSSFDRLSKYEAFKQLVADDTTSLGEFNGEILTPRKLAQDLATYAFLSNTQNGATGFIIYIAIPYLETIGVTKNYRKINKDLLEGNYETKLDKFREQYFQHNPQRATILSKYNMESMNFTPVKGDIKKPDTLEAFELFPDEDYFLPEYVAVRNPKIKHSSKKWNLYKLTNPNNFLYEKIDTLGTDGFNEYNPVINYQTSALVAKKPVKIRENVSSAEYYDKKDNAWIKIPLIENVLPKEKGIENVLNVIYNSSLTSENYKKVIERLQEYVNKDIKLEYAIPSKNSLGSYNPTTNTITIAPDIYEVAINKTGGNYAAAVDMVKEVLLEEIIHSITVNEFKQYVEKTSPDGTVILKENSPIFATKLVAAYEAARKEVPYNPEDISTYYSKDIYEFIAGMYVSQDYQERIEKANPSIINNFKSAIKRLFDYLANKFTGKELDFKEEIYQAIDDLLATTKEVNVSEKGKGIKLNPIKQMKQEDKAKEINVQVEPTRIDVGKLSDYRELTDEKFERGDMFGNSSKTVTTLSGETFNVNPNDITTYQTETGPVRYIIDSNGNMVMLKEESSSTNSIVERTNSIITRDIVKSNPEALYLFGDNDIRKGLGGQAKEMRGEPNTIGISTKKLPATSENAYKTDTELEQNKNIIDQDIQKVKEAWATGKYNKIVIPPIGVGLAKLAEKAPQTFAYLQEQLKSLELLENTQQTETPSTGKTLDDILKEQDELMRNFGNEFFESSRNRYPKIKNCK